MRTAFKASSHNYYLNNAGPEDPIASPEASGKKRI